MKKLFMGLAMLLLLVCFAGCGVEKPKDTADQAILAYGQLYLYADTTNVAKTGLPEKDVKDITDKTDKLLQEAFARYDLPQSSWKEMSDYYLKAGIKASDMKARIKTESDTNPVVEVSYKPLDSAKFMQMQNAHEGLNYLKQGRDMLIADGEDPSKDPDYVSGVTMALKQLYDNMPTLAAKTMDVKCKIAKDAKGNTVWTPEDPNAFVAWINQ